MAEISRIQTLLAGFKSKNILVVGDVMVDEYLWGAVTRISPEAPVPVVSCNKREHRMGGAANVAINIRALGANPVICSVIGGDDTGMVFRGLLKRREMSEEGVLEAAGRVTTVKTRVIGGHQQLLRIDHENTDFLDDSIEQELFGRIKKIIQNSVIDAIIFQDYDKGVLTPGVVDNVISLANSKGIPTLVDPKKRSFLSYKNVTLFKPNFKELKEGLNLALEKSDIAGINKAASGFMKGHKIANIMVTLSEKGVFATNGGEFQVYPAESRDITDVSGAGDTVISVVALCLACGLDVFQSALLSNIAGGLVCEKVGVVPITPEMLLKENINLP